MLPVHQAEPERRPGLDRGRPVPGPRHRRRPMKSAQDLWAAVDRPNVLIKIPATDAGLPAIRRATAEGISVNVTLIFGIDRYREVMDAYLAGLEDAQDSRARPAPRSTRWRRSSSPASTPRSTSGSTRSAPTRPTRCRARPPSPTPGSPTRPTRRSSAPSASPRSSDAGANVQRPLWASTGVKDPALPRHDVRHRPRRRRHRQHDAGEDPRGVRRPR